MRLLYVTGALMACVALTACSSGATASNTGMAARRPASTPSVTLTAPRSVTAAKSSFPPKTIASFQAFAATGNARQVHQVAVSSEGLSSCPTRNIYVTVRPHLTGRELEADLSAYFLQSGVIGSQCQAFIFAFRSRSDYQTHKNDGYTVGRVALTNDSGSQRDLEVDTGEVTSEAYNPRTQFNFKF
jgi:hypothetical protein